MRTSLVAGLSVVALAATSAIAISQIRPEPTPIEIPPEGVSQVVSEPAELPSEVALPSDVGLASDVALLEVGLVDPATGQWYLVNENGTANSFFFGNPGDIPFVGDWDCDGIETPGLYRQSDGFVYLRNTNTQGPADLEFFFGDPGDLPLAGDFNGNGCDTVSIYRPNQARVFVINELGQNQGGLGAADYDFFFGNIGDKPVVGDFDGDGTDTIGLHRESTGFVYYRNTNATGNADAQFFFGDPGDKIVAADWNNNTSESFGIYRPFTTTFYLRYTNSGGNADKTISYGDSDWLPVAGNFGTEQHTGLPPTGSVSFTAGGDIGATNDTDVTLEQLATQKGDFFLALGDLSYSDLEEPDWCNYAKGYLGANFPIQVLVGNHEDDDRKDGFIGEFAKCLPDRMNSTGTYAAEYYFDVDGMARIIMIGAGNDVDGVKYDYEKGNDRYGWLAETIDDAAAEGIPWVIVGMHKVCITAGNKPCEIGEDLINLLIDKNVDLVLSGHDHDYQRSHQLDCVLVDGFDPSCIANNGSDGIYPAGRGTVFVITGLTGGGGKTEIDPNDSEFPYFASTLGAGPNDGRGFFHVTLTSSTLTGSFVGTTTSFSDTFTIK